MKKCKVFRSINFQKEISKYNKNLQDRIDKIESLVESKSDNLPITHENNKIT